MTLQQLVYEDGNIAVALLSLEDGQSARLAVRWLDPPQYKGKDGRVHDTTNVMGGATDWFIVPLTFGTAIGRTLVEQNAAGLSGFDDAGFAALVQWLIASDELEDAMCY